MGAMTIPLLPVARGQPAGADPEADPGDPSTCGYWRHCAMDGFLCSCCGGTHTACPPGTIVSAITRVGTCRNPADGRDYIISYNDCCGKSSCGRCLCNRNEGDRPLYRPSVANDYSWCVGSETTPYHCTLAVVVGVTEA